MQTINILDLAPPIREWLNQIQVGQDVLITADDQAVAKITRVNGAAAEPATAKPKRRQAGTANPKGRQAGLSDDILWISPDFDEPLEDFAEYMS